MLMTGRQQGIGTTPRLDAWWFVAALLAVVALGVMAFLTAGHAQAASASADMSQIAGRINQLENQLQTLSRTVYRGESPRTGRENDRGYESRQPIPAAEGSAMANYEIRLSELENQMRYITGQIERQNHEIRQLKQQLDRFQSDTEQRLSSGYGAQGGSSYNGGGAYTAEPRDGRYDSGYPAQQQGGASYDAQPQQQYPTGRLGTIRQPAPDARRGGDNVATLQGVPTVGSAMTPERQYEQAFLLVRDGEYQQAENLFSDFMGKYPEHRLASNAQYWLGETYYVRGNYQHAAKVFAQGYQKFPDSTKGPDYLLKLGLSLAQMGKKTDACLSFQQLEKDFGNNAGSPVLRRARMEKKRLGC